MNSIVARLAFVSMLLSITTACSGIRVVKRANDGGIVALQGPESGAREKADEYMRSQCPKGYEIVEEGEAVVGQTAHATTRQGFIGPVTTAQTEDRREWRITYKCKGVENASAAAKTLYVAF